MISEPSSGYSRPDAHLLGDGGDGLRCQFSGGAKAHGLRAIIGILGRIEDPVDDATMVMNMAVEGRPEAVDEAQRPEAGKRASAAAPAQMGLDDAQQDSPYDAEGLRLALHVGRPALPFPIVFPREREVGLRVLQDGLEGWKAKGGFEANRRAIEIEGGAAGEPGAAERPIPPRP
jgi:hypothetical protein